MKTTPSETLSDGGVSAEHVRHHKHQLRVELKPHYDFIVCGSGSSGSVVAGRLAENDDVSVLLLEAGGQDDVEAVMRAEQWSANLGSERDWNFVARPNAHLNGRSIPYSMGKVLGGGSSINVMAWARGHKNDWDFFAAEAEDDSLRSCLVTKEGFRRHLGMSPTAYVRVVRLRRAHRDLRSADPTRHTVASIAHRWGFTHLSRFAAAHKTMYGQTPLQALRAAH
jgi:choline dehydrogenase-like flavoprotein